MMNLSYSVVFIGSGLHTFVLYLGPHIALFTLKATQCGRVDIKSAPYDTIQLKRGPSWLDKDCIEFGPPVFSSLESMRVPLSSILPQIQMEAILWGLGTALGELPPYFISKAGMYMNLFTVPRWRPVLQNCFRKIDVRINFYESWKVWECCVFVIVEYLFLGKQKKRNQKTGFWSFCYLNQPFGNNFQEQPSILIVC